MKPNFKVKFVFFRLMGPINNFHGPTNKKMYPLKYTKRVSQTYTYVFINLKLDYNRE